MAERIYSVTQLALSIRRNLLSNNAKLAGVWIEGEVSGNKVYASGHRYFTLKDKDAAISCVLFAFNLRTCDEDFKKALAKGEDTVNGLKVQVEGELDLNMLRGQYAFKVQKLRLKKDELGARMAQFNALKAQLEKEGYNKLDHPERRRRLPFLPHRIGIVTSPAGAVIHDLCYVITRRFPNVEIRLYPAKVQGEGAAEKVVEGIRFFNGLLVNADVGWRPDVLIVARGGGSMEDLWTFNETSVVYAVANSSIPVISAVGHESDFTLCDYAADFRAGTPSIAGECVVPVKRDLEKRVADLRGRLDRVLRNRVENLMQQTDDLVRRIGRAPEQALARAARRLEGLTARLAPALKDPVARLERRVQRAELGLVPAMRSAVQRADAAVGRLDAKLGLLDAGAVLKRGYSVTTDAQGRVVRAAAEVKAGDRLATRLGEGAVESVAV